MKVLSYSWLLAICLLLGLTSVHAADFEADHKLVIQINKQDPDLYGHVLSNINNLHKHYGVDNLQVEVVAYGPGIWMLTEDSPVKERIAALQLVDVVFTACLNTLDTIERDSGTRPVLLEDIEEFQAGIARIIELQEAGYSYLSP
ncbi:MAG: DsrE family protein [Thiolinea sp.]